jgi:sugar lactone lactonase YvrE
MPDIRRRRISTIVGGARERPDIRLFPEPRSTFMKTLLLALLVASALPGLAQKIEPAASFAERQVTGVAVSKDGRLFVNFPLWSDAHDLSVAEVDRDGSLRPFPNEEWNRKDDTPANRWVCVQSVHVDDAGFLWVLDAASPKMEGVIPGGAKLVKFDLTKNEAVQTITFDEQQAPAKSYLNDVRVETNTNFAYLTESGLGAVLVVNLSSGKIRRVLADHASTKANPELELVAEGIKLIDPKTGKTPQIHADGIALDQKHGYLYFHALTGRTLYRIKTQHLRNERLDDEELGKRVENVGDTRAPDGMLADESGNLLLASFENNSIDFWNVTDGAYRTLIQDKRLQWPDSMAWGPDGTLYVTTSQIHRTPKFNGGKNLRAEPFAVWKITLVKPIAKE